MVYGIHGQSDREENSRSKGPGFKYQLCGKSKGLWPSYRFNNIPTSMVYNYNEIIKRVTSKLGTHDHLKINIIQTQRYKFEENKVATYTQKIKKKG